METATEGPGWRCLWASGCELGESPVWDSTRGVLWFVDIEREVIHRIDPKTLATVTWTATCRVGAVGLRRAGGLIAATERGFAVLDPDAGTTTWVGHPEPELETNRFNDGKVDALGRFWAGTMDESKAAAQGTIYRLDPDLTWTTIDVGYVITNGPAFSPDLRILYENDTLGQQTFAYDIAADGTLSGKRVLADWSGRPGNPDGLTTDADGCLWIAFWDGWCIRRVSPSGEVLGDFAMPVSNVSSMAFGGANLDRLFVTSARQGLDADAIDAQPLAGGVFEVIGHNARGMASGIFTG